MSKKIHTIQSSDKKEFDNQVNLLLEVGGELMDGGYEVIKDDDGFIYSQIIVIENCEIEFYENGQLRFVGNKNKDGKLNGLYTKWWENRQKSSEGTYKNGKKDGLYTEWYVKGQKSWEWTYKEGKKDGVYTNWYSNGQKRYEENFKNGKYDGLSTNWYENGQKSGEGTYKDGDLISTIQFHEDGSVREEPLILSVRVFPTDF